MAGAGIPFCALHNSIPLGGSALVGDIGTEMFLNTYWIGQMLDCKLRINVVSKEPEGTFENKPCFNIFVTVNGMSMQYIISENGKILHKGAGEHSH